MSSTAEENSENTCVVCFKTVEFFSIGECDHPVCYECSTRMRVLCRQTECPICRQEMPKVIFTKDVRPFREIKNGHYLVDRKFKIEFSDLKIRQAYDSLLDHRCTMCPDPVSFQNFAILKQHMLRNHELFYCDLCVENLKILTRERRCYTRRELDQHRKTGDPDDKSHKGHPLCEFCDSRYMDKDELCRHLRRDHLFCHFCDADGYNYFYSSYDSLRDHFRTDHFLCEEGNCYEEKFTAVFRTEIDLRAHRASVHGRMIGKAATKQARTLELAFKLTPRPGDQRRRGAPMQQQQHHYHQQQQQQHYQQQQQHHQQDNGFEEGAVGYDGAHPQHHYAGAHINTDCINEFPTLDGKAATTSKTMMIRTAVQGGKQLAVTDENFPALGPEATVSLRVNSSSASDRPKSISQVMKSHQPNVSIHVTNHRPVSRPSRPTNSGPINLNRKPSRDDFPALGKESEAFESFKLPQSLKQLNPQWSSGRNVESKVGVVQQNQTKNKPTSSKTNFSMGEENFPGLSLRFESGCNVKNEPSSSKNNNNNNSNTNFNRNNSKETKKPKPASSSLSFPAPSSQQGTPARDNFNNGNFSSDSDVGNRTGNSKKKKTGKNATANDSSNSLSRKEQPGVQKNSSTDSLMSAAKKETEFSEVKNKKKTKTNRSEEPNQSSTNGETVARKRTELNIGLTNNKSDDTESESGPNDNASLQKVSSTKPPGFVDILRDKPPPGFNNVIVPPPPGFNSTSIMLNSIARNSVAPPYLSNNLTFTNSCGQSYPIAPGIKTPLNGAQTYIPLTDFNDKNTELLGCLRSILDDTLLNELLNTSKNFRQNAISAREFYKYCLEKMGSHFNNIFPELLFQLPDIQKQQELLEEYQLLKGDADGSDTVIKQCTNCGQVVRAQDLVQHSSFHLLDNHFPLLSNGFSSSTLQAKK